MYKGSKKTQYFGEQMKLNCKIWDVFQSKLVKSCSFFGTFNGLMAEKSLATLKIALFLRTECNPGNFNRVYGDQSKLVFKHFMCPV